MHARSWTSIGLLLLSSAIACEAEDTLAAVHGARPNDGTPQPADGRAPTAQGSDAQTSDAQSSDAAAPVDGTSADVASPAPGTCADAVPGAPVDDPFRRVRTTVDLADDAPGEYQLHALYVEPSDRTSNPRLDEDGSIRRSMTAWNQWLAARMGGPKLRVDTCGGVIDLTHVKLGSAFTESATAQGTTLAPNGTGYIRDRLEAELKKTFTDPKKIYLVYYDGLAYGHCGGAPLPPSLIGRFPALFIGGIWSATFLTSAAASGSSQLTVYDPASAGLPSGAYAAKLGSESVSVTGVSGTSITLAAPLTTTHASGETLVADARPPDCRTNPFSADGTSLGYTDYSGAHEVLHTLGIVASAAKYHSSAAPGHLTEASAGGTSDLMYQGAQAWACSGTVHANPAASPCVLDPAHENYFNLPAGSAAVDLARSVFVEPKPVDAAFPPGW